MRFANITLCTLTTVVFHGLLQSSEAQPVSHFPQSTLERYAKVIPTVPTTPSTILHSTTAPARIALEPANSSASLPEAQAGLTDPDPVNLNSDTISLSSLTEAAHLMLPDQGFLSVQPPQPGQLTDPLNPDRWNSEWRSLTRLLAQEQAANRQPLSPIQLPPNRLINLETAHQLFKGAVQIRGGFQQTPPADRPNSGTGDEVYYGAIEWGASDRLQLALTGQYFDDPVGRAINGAFPDYSVFSLAPSFKYQLRQGDRLALALHGSAELFRLSTSPGLFNATNEDQTDTVLIGALQVPLSYRLWPQLQWHFTPGVAFFPETINGADFFGSFFNLGTGVSWKPTDRLNLFWDLNFPLGPGGNTLDSNNSEIVQRLLWGLGASYAVTPKVAIDLYGSNAFGATPTTRLLAFIPDASQALIGASLRYTPDVGQGYASSFRRGEALPLSERDWSLAQDGLTLTSANTLPPGAVALSGGASTGDQFNVSLAYSPDQDLQLEVMIDEFGGEEDISVEDSAGTDLKYMFGAKVRFLDQQQGDPFSLSARLLGGRDTGANRQVGILFPELPMTYEVNSQLAVLVNPRAAFYADQSRIGVGLGANYALPFGAQLIGEVTPVVNETTVWSIGARYPIPRTGIGLDVYATNAIGRNGLGGLLAESGSSFGFNLNLALGNKP